MSEKEHSTHDNESTEHTTEDKLVNSGLQKNSTRKISGFSFPEVSNVCEELSKQISISPFREIKTTIVKPNFEIPVDDGDTPLECPWGEEYDFDFIDDKE